MKKLLALLITACAAWGGGEAPTQKAPTQIIAFDTPFLFSYGTWQNKAKVQNGRALLTGDGVTGKGGAGLNVNLNLSGRTKDCSPALKLKTGPANKVSALRLMLRDKEHGAIYEFPLPTPSQDFVLVTPRDGAPLSAPNSTDKGMPDLSAIVQWQIQGDWGAGVLDVALQSVELVEPDEATRAARAAAAQRAEKARQAVLAEQAALRAQYGKRNPLSPTVQASLAAADVLTLTFDAGRVLPGSLTKYEPLGGDAKEEKKSQAGVIEEVILKRGGQAVGWLIGPNRDNLVAFEKFEGDPLLAFLADLPATYTITSQDDPAFNDGAHPIAVYRKSKPLDWAQPRGAFAMRHTLYLKLAHPLVAGKSYAIDIGELNANPPSTHFLNDPSKISSDAIHVNQIGYRPDDPVKRAFLSTWMGTGGGLNYPANLRFHLVDANSGAAAYSGSVEIAKLADEKELMWRDENMNKADVWRMDFSSFGTPGRYRICVEGIGCSHPFDIGLDVWQRAFLVQMKGLYNERSGMALGPPYTEFVKPRDFHPGDGAKVFQSTYSILDGGNEQELLEKHSTGKPVPEAWGGYHDAGDWNPRRVTHLRVTMAQMEIAGMFPKYFGELKLNIPHTEGVSDILAEALFEIDCFRRLQLPDGGVRYGIETNGDPYEGEVSWLQSMTAYVYAADPWGSSVYAAAAARAALLLRATRPDLAKVYSESAVRAMEWAEAERTRMDRSGKDVDKLRSEIRGDRALAAIVLYQLTGDEKWHDLFKMCRSFATEEAKKGLAPGDRSQYDAAFVYASMHAPRSDADLERHALAIITAAADRALAYASNNAWNLTTPDKGLPMFQTFYSEPDARELARAHFLTGDPKYLAGVVQATQFQSGANPGNITYTTGVGSNPVQHPLHLDSRRTGQKTPDGITVYGNFDFVHWPDWSKWVHDYYLNAALVPAVAEWPVPEAYFDIFMYPSTNEFTVDAWEKNIFAWGYLAARK